VKRLKVIALLLAPLLLLAGCSAFFGFNAFSSFDKPPAPKLSDYTGSGGLANLQDDLNSKAIVAALAGDPTTVQQIESYLSTTYLSGPLATPEAQQAAALYADLNLKTTTGAELVETVVTLILSNNPPEGDLATILASILPPGATADEPTFTAMVNALLNANTAYQLLGASVPPAPPGMNMGDVVEKAAVAYSMDSIVDQVISGSGLGLAAATHQLFLLSTNQVNTISLIPIVDPFAATPAWLTNLFDAAGVTPPA
jgi:hypothetical protein